MTDVTATRPPAERSELEELANVVTHGVGAVLAVVGFIVLVVVAAVRGAALDVAAVAVYGVCLVLLYLASTLYHSARPQWLKALLLRCDHAAIFLMIAGTYTPVCLLVVGGALGHGLLAAVWLMAGGGALCKASGRLCCGFASTALYLALGWLVVVAFGPMMQALPTPGLMLLVLGGVAYTAGVAFFHWERLPYNHAVWHLFTLAGSAFHYFAILHYALPASA
jgi:hemolysin III